MLLLFRTSRDAEGEVLGWYCCQDCINEEGTVLVTQYLCKIYKIGSFQASDKLMKMSGRRRVFTGT
jgi:hypothetical protein